MFVTQCLSFWFPKIQPVFGGVLRRKAVFANIIHNIDAFSCLYIESRKRQLHMASKRTEQIKFLVLTYFWCEKKEPVSSQETI